MSETVVVCGLSGVRELTTIAARLARLRKFLQSHDIGELCAEETNHLQEIYNAFYKVNDEENIVTHVISRALIARDPHGCRCFMLQFGDTLYPCAVRRLAGATRTSKGNIAMAARYAITEQIRAFRQLETLDPDQICPISGEPLGTDAEVDHVIPFAELLDSWMKTLPDLPKLTYNTNAFVYMLSSPYLESWREYHQSTAILRYLSKKGNRVAHLPAYNKRARIN